MKHLLLLLLPIFVWADTISEKTDIIFDDSQVAEIYIELPADSLAWIYDNVESDKYFHSTMRYKTTALDTLVENTGFRLRGNTSRGAQKKSFKISFSEFESGRKFFGLKKFNLNGEHNDPSIMRAKLSWDLFGHLAVPASRASHVKVFINDQYYGLYLNVEHYDDVFLRSRFGNDVGNLYKCLWPADLVYEGENGEDYQFSHEGRRTYDLKTNEQYDDYTDLARFITVLNQTPAAEFPDSIFTYFDVWNYLKILSLEVLTGSWDDYWFLKNNYYLYNDQQEGRFSFIPYDYDNTFGISWFHDFDWGTENIYTWGNGRGESRPLVDRILAVPQFKNIYSFWMNHILDNYFNPNYLTPHVDSLKTKITPAAEADIYRTYDYGFSISEFHDSYDTPLGHTHVTYSIKDYIATRYESAKEQLNPADLAPVFMAPPSIKFVNNSLIKIGFDIFDENRPLTAAIVLTTDNATDTLQLTEYDIQADGDLAYYHYSFEIPQPENFEAISYYFYVADVTGQVSRLPFNAPTAEYTIVSPELQPDICINEFLAANETVITDPKGDYEDWVEIYNKSATTISLDGFYLTDDPDELQQWPFPEVTLGPNEHLLVWADDDADDDDTGLHTNFKLDKEGEYIALVKVSASGTTIIDSLTFREQSPDISYGRSPDGSETWLEMSPTPGRTNNATSIDTKTKKIVSRFTLSQNYPNPFNPSTKIDYTLPNAGPVTITVYDMLGNYVTTLVDEYRNAGQYQVTWYGQDMLGKSTPTGIYFYKMKAGGFTKMKKMLYIK